MSEIKSNTAILVFALSPTEDMRRKQIQKGRTLFSALSKHTIAQVKKTKLPFVHYDGNYQKGTGFGERFANAIADLFNQGFENVIALGNDCPQLTHKHILQTATALSLGKNVIAPSLDGGFNLLGIQKSVFKKEVFVQLPWQKKQLFSQTLTYFGQWGQQPEILEAFVDVDRFEDVYSLLSKLRSVSLALYDVFIELVQNLQRKYHYTVKQLKDSYFSLLFNKGSPIGPS